MTSEPTAQPDRADAVFVEHRPWGDFQQFVANETVTVKLITVLPGSRLSLQRHAHRQELWQVLEGTAWTLVDGVERMLGPGERVLVGVGQMHRLGNPEATPLRVLEIAFGHFDEADIERFDDDHARPTT